MTIVLTQKGIFKLCSCIWRLYCTTLTKYVKLDMQCQLHSKRKEDSVDTAEEGYEFLYTEALASLLNKIKP